MNSKQYGDYAGVRVKIDLPSSEAKEDIEKITASLSKINTKNKLYEKYVRHNFIYLTLVLCNVEAKGLIKKIGKALDDSR